MLRPSPKRNAVSSTLTDPAMVAVVLADSTADCDSVRLGSNPNGHPKSLSAVVVWMVCSSG